MKNSKIRAIRARKSITPIKSPVKHPYGTARSKDRKIGKVACSMTIYLTKKSSMKSCKKDCSSKVKHE